MARVKTILILILAVITAVITLLSHMQTAVAQPQLQTTTVLYDGSLNTGTPNTQAMLYISFPAGSYETFTNGVTILDTTSANGISAGYFGNDPTLMLDRSLGYTLHVTVQISSESHANNNRAGFSVIVLSSDVKGIELGFWQDEVWAQNDDSDPGSLFTHGEGAAWDTTSGLMAYDLAILSDTYTLWAGDTAVLTGALRDYSNFAGFPDPYETPNLIFLGDDTTSAQALIQLSYVAVTVNELPVAPHNLLFLPFVVK
jgi:hypothetical protein